ncbi:extracellular solute-binding protein [Oscillospiraceae bacterium HV4-5-C5C]|nr:extracellular solute-binding protein [Oscillospiraceae bacterium HV4-5-C5C]
MKRFLATAVSMTILLLSISACSNSSTVADSTSTTAKANTETSTQNDETTATTASESDSASTTESGSDASEYPLSGGTLTYWVSLNSNVAANYSSLADTPYAKEYEALTGVHIEYQHPASGQENEQFNLMMASAEYPDIIDWNWLTYSGGPQKAIDDGVILSLNDVMAENAPNLTTYLQANPDIDKMVKTDEGNYYVFPFIREQDNMCASFGPQIRADWLEDLGLETPKTVADLENVLIAFKEQKGATAPYSYEYSVNNANDPIMFGFGTSKNFQINSDGKVEFGSTTEAYKAYLETMNKWYQEGLLDADIASVDGSQLDSKITSGLTGFTVGWIGSGMGKWNQAGVQNDANFQLEALNYVTEDGSQSEYSYMENRYGGGGSAAITTACKDVELAAKYLDFGYSEAGYLANNYGTEGESYTVENGTPTYTDQILKNADGWPIAQAMGAYIRACYNGQFIQSYGYQEQYFQTQAQKDAPTIWTDTNEKAHLLPPITPTSDESAELATIMNDINTYRDEATLNFIIGNESLADFDQYVETINSMGIDRAIEIETAALERYQNR